MPLPCFFIKFPAACRASYAFDGLGVECLGLLLRELPPSGLLEHRPEFVGVVGPLSFRLLLPLPALLTSLSRSTISGISPRFRSFAIFITFPLHIEHLCFLLEDLLAVLFVDSAGVGVELPAAAFAAAEELDWLSVFSIVRDVAGDNNIT